VNKTIIFSAIILFYLCGCNGSNPQPDFVLQGKITNTIDQLVKDNNIPGLNVSIVFKDGKQINCSSGYADVENKIKLEANHIMFSGSIGKTYAAALLMQLNDKGKIELEDKLIDYFPQTDWLNRLPNIQEITIKMLLQHTSGLPRYAMKSTVWDSLNVNPNKIWSYKDRLSIIFENKPLHKAGQGWAYSDTNYILLGMLIEKLSKTYYYDVLKSEILIPEKLNATFAADKRNIPGLPIGYSKLPEMFKMPDKVVVDGKYVFNPQLEWTGGGIASTTSDLAKWAKVYYEGKLFSDSLLNKIITPNENGKAIEDSLAYGMGSFIYETKNGKAFGHTGFVPGFVSIFAYYPANKLFIAMQINCDYATKNLSLIKYLEKILVVVAKNPK
jgi:D-alanyl-D-alanine carboxypeptidase